MCNDYSMAKKEKSKSIILYYAVENINEIIELIDKKTSLYIKYACKKEFTRLPVKVVINWQLAYILGLIKNRRIFIKYIRDGKET